MQFTDEQYIFLLILKDSKPDLVTKQIYRDAMNWFYEASALCAASKVSLKDYCTQTLIESPITMSRFDQLVFISELHNLFSTK